MPLLSKKTRPKDTIGRILDPTGPQPIKIIQTKEPRNLLTPWITPKKTLEFHYELPPAQPANPATLANSGRSTAPPAYIPIDLGDKAAVQVATAEMTGYQGMFTTGITVLGSVATVVMGVKKAYDMYTETKE